MSRKVHQYIRHLDKNSKHGQLGYMIHSTISETKNHLSELLAQVRVGETLIIMDRKTPVARVEAISHPGDNPFLSQPEVEWNPQAIRMLPIGTGEEGIARLDKAVREERESGW